MTAYRETHKDITDYHDKDVILNWNKLEDQNFNSDKVKSLLLKHFSDLETQLKIQHVQYEVLLNECSNLTSLKGLGKSYLQHVGTSIYIPITIRSHILGALRSSTLHSLAIQNGKMQNGAHLKRVNKESETWAYLKQLSAAVDIINICLYDKNNDILECKETLISLGLKDYAKL
jgi:hypothetical protein